MNDPESAIVNDRFYQDLKPFSDFAEITDDRHFKPVPTDWCVVIADVKGSTLAIESGQYKEVNTIGAASIVVVQNALKGIEFPFVFGGDGASLLIPPSCRELVSRKLGSLKRLAAENFGLELRVGIVDVSEIVDEKTTIEVAKFELAPGKCVAILRGGGLTRTETLVKKPEGNHEIRDSDSSSVDLGGLSCRWNDIPNRRGCILSMLVVASEDGPRPKQVYLELLDQIQSIFSRQQREENPVNLSSMSYRSLGDSAKNERRFHRRFSFGWILCYLEIVASAAIFRGKLQARLPFFRRYANSMPNHSDYRKFDDMLRMVIDCSPEQVDALIQYLEKARQRGDLFYGLHQSETSLMTCYVHSLQDGDHLHFIDGGNGGYAMAAKKLKEQMRSMKG